MNLLTLSEAGGHPRNEDSLDVRVHPTEASWTIVFLADGLGGRAGGRAAAELACSLGSRWACELDVNELADPEGWVEILRRVDEAVESDSEAGFTTLVGLGISDSDVVGASVGDSAALLASEDRVVELTRSQRKDPPLGSGEAEPIGFAQPFAEPWRILAMTDGVWKYSGWANVIAAAKGETAVQSIDQLQQRARLPGTGRFPDDFTIVLAESNGVREHGPYGG